ncbi:MAG: aldehyde dehydrogenase family protein [Gammaproteobacteria bacterium]|nr:aldehyde dehydrogenase family protein [Gammaproteobacteria bacterium]MBI5615004.1 aldehyde dehydrogenase family protein [Gammaproteobacteria bacterium]
MKTYDKLYINGAWVKPVGTGTIDARCASTEEVVTRIPEGVKEDAERAVAAARAAFEGWSNTPVAVRSEYLARLAAGMEARQKDVALAIATEVGMPIKMANAIQASLPIVAAKTYAELVKNYAFEETVGTSLVVREAIGVVACITPWNFPINQIMLKVAPALAAGCTVILKPSEVAPTTAFILAEIIDELKLPAGVFNLVTGYGPVVGEVLASHPEVDMVSFTGSTRAGRRVAELAAGTIKRVALELGGKSPHVICEDADLEKAVKAGVNECYLNSGQACIAPSRMLAPRSKYEEVVALAKKAAESFTVGDPINGDVKLGPLISAVQRDRVRDFIKKGVAEGARLVTGGAEVPEGLDKGYYVKPTVFADVNNDMTIAREEIFGPVLAIIPYDTEEDAIRIANDTIYGLGGNVWAGTKEHATAVAKKIRTGQISVNGGRYNPLAPFGGYKQSGLGREAGKFGLEEFLEVKSLQL